MENSLSTLIDTASSILVLLPDKPNFDVVAAGLGLYLSLRDKKQTSISSLSPMVVDFNRLVGVNKIGSELGNKNLTIRFKDYDAASIEKVSYDIINGEFNLTVVPKTGQIAPQDNQIKLNYSGISADLVVLVGGASVADFAALSDSQLSGAKIVHIGTRVFSDGGENQALSFAKPASSISELIAELIKSSEFPIDVDVATNLLAGIEEGSENFESSEVTPETFETFAYLLRNGGQRMPKKLEAKDFPPGAIPGVQVFKHGSEEAPGTKEEEQDVNPPEDWLQPKVIKGAAGTNQPTTFSENKG